MQQEKGLDFMEGEEIDVAPFLKPGGWTEWELLHVAMECWLYPRDEEAKQLLYHSIKEPEDYPHAYYLIKKGVQIFEDDKVRFHDLL